MRAVPAPLFNPLLALREALTPSPSLRTLAKVCGVSPAALSLFEQGRTMLGPATLAKYAQAVGRPESDIRTRFLMASVIYHDTQARKARLALKEIGAATRRGRWSRAGRS